MQYLWEFAVFLALAFGISLLIWPVVRWIRGGFWLSVGAPPVLLLTPVVISPEHIRLRALAAVVTIELFFKTIDYLVQWRRSECVDSRFQAYVLFLVPFPTLLVRMNQRKRESPVASCWPQAIGWSILFLLMVEFLRLLNSVAVVQSSFWLDHSVKFIVFTVAIHALGYSLYGVERMVGYSARPLIDSAFQSKTVGEFWSRYNTRVHSWLGHHVFRPAGGRRAPVRALFVTFLMSALFHELMFGIATSRWDGYQFAFFMLQAPAVVVWHWLQSFVPKNIWGEILMRGSTIAWMWATSILFFHGVNRVFPFFYASTPILP